VASFGARLKLERERRGVTLNEISQSTKISSRLLKALEDEHFDQLPGGIFNKGFIRAYARFLGMDEEEAIADYMEATGGLPADKKQETLLDPLAAEFRQEAGADGAASLPWGLFAVVLLIIALAFAGWGFYSREIANKPGAGSLRHTKDVARPAPMSGAPANGSGPPQPAAGNDQKAPAITPVSTNSSSAPVSAEAPAGRSAASGAATKAISVRIVAREDSWIAIAADGKKIMQDTLLAPAEKSVQADKEIVVKAGNIGALDLEWNGKKLPPQGAEGEVITLSFGVDGWRTVPKPPAPSEQPNPPN